MFVESLLAPATSVQAYNAFHHSAYSCTTSAQLQVTKPVPPPAQKRQSQWLTKGQSAPKSTHLHLFKHTDTNQHRVSTESESREVTHTTTAAVTSPAAWTHCLCFPAAPDACAPTHPHLKTSHHSVRQPYYWLVDFVPSAQRPPRPLFSTELHRNVAMTKGPAQHTAQTLQRVPKTPSASQAILPGGFLPSAQAMLVDAYQNIASSCQRLLAPASNTHDRVAAWHCCCPATHSLILHAPSPHVAQTQHSLPTQPAAGNPAPLSKPRFGGGVPICHQECGLASNPVTCMLPLLAAVGSAAGRLQHAASRLAAALVLLRRQHPC
jgi:hypothetical protein